MGENWHSERSATEDHVVLDARGAEICTVPRDVNHSAQIAHLIASAPDLKAENERLRAALKYARALNALLQQDSGSDLAGPIDAAREREKKLADELKRSLDAWSNILDLGLVPENYRPDVRVVIERIDRALAAHREAGE